MLIFEKEVFWNIFYLYLLLLLFRHKKRQIQYNIREQFIGYSLEILKHKRYNSSDVFSSFFFKRVPSVSFRSTWKLSTNSLSSSSCSLCAWGFTKECLMNYSRMLHQIYQEFYLETTFKTEVNGYNMFHKHMGLNGRVIINSFVTFANRVYNLAYSITFGFRLMCFGNYFSVYAV